MIQAFKKSGEGEVLQLRRGDKLRLPLKMNWAKGCDTFELKAYRHNSGCSTAQVQEVSYADLVNFDCTLKGTFSIQIRDYPKDDQSPFAIYIGEEKFFRGYRGSASSLSEYVEKVFNHFKKAKGWEVSRNGNILNFKSKKPCKLCGFPISIGMGDFRILNTNNPCVSTVSQGEETVTGRKCYSVKISSVVEGNRFVLNGVTYNAGISDTVQTMTDRLTSGNGFVCVPNGQGFTLTASNGERVVRNTNDPKLSLLYNHSDEEKDYYTAVVSDVREGNIFSINGITITASDSDTASTIAAAFNSDGGYFSTDLGSSIAVNVTAGVRRVENTNNPTVSTSLIEDVANSTKDKYSVTICEDVAAGNIYTIDGKVYVAEEGDTSIDVAYKMFGENQSTFAIYKNDGEPLLTSVEVGSRVSGSAAAFVRALTPTVNCCAKDSLIFEFDAVETGCYAFTVTPKIGATMYLNTINVTDKEDGELVEFNNSSDAYGMDFDTSEWFSVRLPLYLRDFTPTTYEEVFESVHGGQTRGVTRITEKREFVTLPVSTPYHDFIVKVLKSENVRIDGRKYTFIGEYSLPPHRGGIKDSRSASGQLTVNGSVSSLEAC